MDEPDESPDEVMNVVRGTEASRWNLGASSCGGGFAVVAEEDPRAIECGLEGPMFSALPNANSDLCR
jgi:hypothetical protein